MNSERPLTGEALRFVAVGVASLLTHWLVLLALVETLKLTPAISNVGGFMVALNVSYWGHRKLTFGASALPHASTLPRFLTVALLSFAVNEFAYLLLLSYTYINYAMASLLVLGGVSAMTYVLSKHWAFA